MTPPLRGSTGPINATQETLACEIWAISEEAEDAEDASDSTEQQYEADWSAVGASEPQRQLREPRDLMGLLASWALLSPSS